MSHESFASRTNWNLSSNRLAQALARHRAAGKPLLDLTTSNPTACGFRYDGDAILAALSNPASLAYTPDPKGLEPARRAVAAYYAERDAAVDPARLILTTSTSEAYSFVFRLLCNPGDEILVPSPSYPLFDFLAGLQDVSLVRYPLVYDHGWQIDFDALSRAVSPRTRAIIVVHPNNPTGHFCSASDAAKLNDLCSRRHLALIADEVFLDFSLLEPRPRTFAANDSALTFTLSGISKISGLPQMKLAWLAVSGPSAARDAALARLEVIADTYLSMNAPIQHAASALIDQRRAFLPQLMDRVRRNIAALDRLLASQTLCCRLEIQGGWYAVLRVPATRSDEDLAISLLASRNVYLHPGHFYDFPSDGYLVVSLITPESDFAQGIDSLLRSF
ncbi:MAG TPA: pyridoxal phosphate-dependent aminotransferase [Candidatus Limnocylindrales bacterium]|nr:pyridoxal phosphate-dependent aminotransferase [Candidatus Limnocylindrales bacterium]